MQNILLPFFNINNPLTCSSLTCRRNKRAILAGPGLEEDHEDILEDHPVRSRLTSRDSALLLTQS